VRNSRSLTVSAQGDREIVMTRIFDAPRELVFEALTKPELLKQWLGVRGGWSLAVCEIDLRVGGVYRYVWRKESTGFEMGAGGVFREIEPPARMVQTESFDDPWYPGESVVTTVLSEVAGETTLQTTSRFESAEARDSVLKGPMEIGVAESYDKLAELLKSIASALSR